jgi:hypothetical protein
MFETFKGFMAPCPRVAQRKEEKGKVETHFSGAELMCCACIYFKCGHVYIYLWDTWANLFLPMLLILYYNRTLHFF